MEHRLVNATITVKQAEEAIEYWLKNCVLQPFHQVKEVTFDIRNEKFTIVFQQDEIKP